MCFCTCPYPPFLLYRARTRLPLFAVCFTIIANTPLPSVHFTHDVAHLFTHLSELLWVSVCVCIVSCHAKPERCWSAGQANGIWPWPGVLWHAGMQDSEPNGQELMHMAARILACQHCICNWWSGVSSTHLCLSLPPSSLADISANASVPSLKKSVGGVVYWGCKSSLLSLACSYFKLMSGRIQSEILSRQQCFLFCYFFKSFK